VRRQSPANSTVDESIAPVNSGRSGPSPSAAIEPRGAMLLDRGEPAGLSVKYLMTEDVRDSVLVDRPLEQAMRYF
jgi:hypothetical protein